MSDGKRRRYRKYKDERDKEKQQRVANFVALDLQPKILLKSKPDREIKETLDSGSENVGVPVGQQKTIIVTRSEAAQSPAMSATTSPNTLMQRETNMPTSSVDVVVQSLASIQLVEPVPKMTRPTTVVSSTGYVNANSKKMLIKQNSEFFVVGIIGTQGVGKSTIMNLLANEQPDYEYYRHVFVEEDSVFRTRMKANKCLTRSGTESIHMFITSDRMILLDTPPVLSNPYKKDMTSTELDDLRLLIGLLSVCHLLIVVQDDYFNLNFVRLLRFAELMKPQTQDNKCFISGYLPQVLFVKNHSTSLDYTSSKQQQFDVMLRACFNDSQLHIFMGQSTGNYAISGTETNEVKQKRARANESERLLNTFFLPDMNNADASKQNRLRQLVNELRRLVFMTPRNQMYNGAAELFTEAVWFDMLGKVWQDTQYFFLNAYEDMHRKVYDVSILSGNGGNINNSNNNNNNGGHHSSYGKDVNDWKD